MLSINICLIISIYSLLLMYAVPSISYQINNVIPTFHGFHCFLEGLSGNCNLFYVLVEMGFPANWNILTLERLIKVLINCYTLDNTANRFVEKSYCIPGIVCFVVFYDVMAWSEPDNIQTEECIMCRNDYHDQPRYRSFRSSDFSRTKTTCCHSAASFVREYCHLHQLSGLQVI